jgi:hypothetical protein
VRERECVSTGGRKEIESDERKEKGGLPWHCII